MMSIESNIKNHFLILLCYPFSNHFLHKSDGVNAPYIQVDGTTVSSKKECENQNVFFYSISNSFARVL